MKIVVANNDYTSSFYEFGHETPDATLLDKHPETVGLVVFTGGADINPALYGERPHPRTHFSAGRDRVEKAVFDKALALKIPMLGICRGAQFLCAMSGGKLVQHVTNHHGYHPIKTNDGRVIDVNSLHHQMMYPTPEARIIAWASPSISDRYEWDKEMAVEPEVVYFPNTNAVAIQYHPEMMSRKTQGFRYAMELTRKLLEGKL